MNKILVTGGAGYLGEILVKKLINEGFQVKVLDIIEPKTEVDFIKGNILDAAVVEAVMRDIDIVIHCAALVPLRKNRFEINRINIQGTRNLLEIAERKKLSNFVFISSSAVYGIPKTLPVMHASDLKPFESYGIAKKEAEKLVKIYRNKGFNASIIRPRTIIGDHRMGLFSLLFKWIKKGHLIPVFNNGENIYQFLHVSDLTDGIIASIKKPHNRDFNLGSFQYGTMRNNLEYLILKTNSKSKIINFPIKNLGLFLDFLSKIKLLPFATYQVKMYGENFYFECKEDWKILEVNPQFSDIDALFSSYNKFIEMSESKVKKSEFALHKIQIKSITLDLFQSIFSLIFLLGSKIKEKFRT